MTDRELHVRLAAFGLVCGLLSLGCLTDGLGAGPAVLSVSGQVQGEEFEGLGGVAEGADGRYYLTLADSGDFDCNNTPTGDYLTIAMGQVDALGDYDAVGRVTFTSTAAALGSSEEATSGTVTIDEIDEADGYVRGSLDASGPESSVSGSFELPMCR